MALCMSDADLYTLAVLFGGDDAYERAQDNACEWEPCCYNYPTIPQYTMPEVVQGMNDFLNQ